MTQIYKVFKESKPFILHNIPLYHSNNDNYIYVKIEFPEDFTTILDSFWEFNGINGISCYCQQPDSIFKQFKSNFKFVKAAGGIVNNLKNEILVIKRNGFLDLPKGHIDKNETAQHAALREVAEECGISKHSISNNKSEMTYHIYKEDNEKVLKETQWFKMQSTGYEPLIPQKEEGIEDVFWMSENEVKQNIKLFYPSLFDLLGGAFQ
jgi:8-oxo-dGTP pyrophosphatase MutT (NUDIX family)